MRLLHTADWHLGKLLEGKSRLEEQRHVLGQFVSFAKEAQADVVCIAGDIFDNGHPSAAAESLFYDTLKKLSNHGTRLVLVIAGNYDQPSRLEAIMSFGTGAWDFDFTEHRKQSCLPASTENLRCSLWKKGCSQ